MTLSSLLWLKYLLQTARGPRKALISKFAVMAMYMRMKYLWKSMGRGLAKVPHLDMMQVVKTRMH